MHDNLTTNIRRVAYILISLLLLLCVYLTFIQIFERTFFVGHPLNRRTAIKAQQMQRGKILDKHNEILAYSTKDGNEYIRYYPYEEMTAHVVGYDSSKYGKVGIEGKYNGYLSGLLSPYSGLGPIHMVVGNKAGNNVTLTLDIDLQEIAYRALGRHRGAIVAISPKTGEILAMVSKPSFDPNRIDDEWAAIMKDKNSLLLNRASNGLYPPGSTLKVMIAEAALRENLADINTTFDCTGSLKIGNYTLNEAGGYAHGKITLDDALAKSCNVTFGKLGLALGNDKIEKTFERYGFAKPINSEIEESMAHLPNFKVLSSGELAQTAIGQGTLLVTPLRMAMLASSFANKGIIMKPYIVSKVTATDGSVVAKNSPSVWLEPTNATFSSLVGKMMVSVVDRGTGQAAGLYGIKVAGKTGTAENPHGASHAWFIGFAPLDNPTIALAVIVENAGSGGAVAAPIARKIFNEALR